MDEKAPRIIKDLVERFERNLADYKTQGYKEDQLRQEFINHFFEGLGWDVGNKSGAAPAYRDVIHEDSIKMTSGGTKAPDYCFTLSGTKKFFVETKKPSVDIKKDPHPAYQLRRYAWSAELPVSILTNFEELAIYESRRKPKENDKVDTELLKRFNYKEYVEKWSEISSIFSKAAILQGSFDKFLESAKQKRGTQEVGDEFLKEIESWRDSLARNIAVRNPQLSSVRELNYAVQSTIDRIIFLRMCEDRGIEQYGQLQALLKNENIYKNLCKIYEKADEKYNSGLFHFTKERGRSTPPDEITLKMIIDDKALTDIIKNIYYPDSPYEFSVLRSEILGNVYEQFLGKIIRLTEGHHAKVEEKPEVKKAGGVYYTPEYIVEYIVKNTVGRLCEGKTPKQIEKLRILDPACGSGSFLLGAYTYLLTHHLDYYTKRKNPRLYKEQIYQGKDGQWFLTVKEKKRILLNNIYGVDIDSQAVEVTKLSLLLKVLEGASRDIFEKQQKLWTERVLPDLGNNIKCGNSLIGPDFYDSDQTKLVNDNEEIYRINAFDWNSEFKEIIQNGGFDVVIGNPPYLRIQGLQEYYGEQINYFIQNYHSAVKRFDLYLLFAERGFKLLCKNGYLGFICPHKFLNSDFGSGLREFFINNSALHSFISFGNNLIFKKATTYTGILILNKIENKYFTYYEFPNTPIPELIAVLSTLKNKDFAKYKLKSFSKEPWIFTSQETKIVIDKISRQPKTLGDVFDEILVGVQSGIDNVHVLKSVSKPHQGIIRLFSERENGEVDIEIGLLKPFLRGEDVHRYTEPQCLYYCIYPYKLVNDETKIIEESELKERFPLGYNYLKKYRDELTEIRTRQKTNTKYWYSCHRSREMAVFERERIITPYISLGCNMSIGPAGIYHNTKVYTLVPSKGRSESLYYWLGLLNSKLLWWFISNTGYVLRGGYFAFTTDYLCPFPIHIIDFSNLTEKTRHNKMLKLVEQMLDFHKRLTNAKAENEKAIIQRQIDSIDQQIDQLVYELYGLTQKEIAIIEKSMQ